MINAGKVNIRMTVAGCVLVLAISISNASAHGPQSQGAKAHPKPEANHEVKASMPAVVRPQEREAALLIGEMYKTEIQPIFERKCYDCHTSRTMFPWYYKVPGIKQLIDEDIEEAKAHLDMEPGFPFRSHSTPIEDLKAVGEEVAKNEMPPLSYKLLHKGSSLTAEEKAKVKAWVDFGIEKLQP